MLLRNSLWNLSGSALPAIAALVTVPLLIAGLGVEGFGIVTLVGSVIGYFGILDINLNAGAIKYLSQYHASDDRKRFAETFWFGIFFYGFLGALGATAIFFSADWLTGKFFDVSSELHGDTVLGFQIAALGFALTQAQNYLITVPQALQRYDKSAQSEAFFGIVVNVASAVAALMGAGIAGVIAVRVAVSACNVLYLCFLIRKFSLGLSFCWPRKDVRSSLTSFSAYAYLSKLASTLHQHGDKLVIGVLAGPVAVTFYSVPVTLSSRILGLTYRLSSVIYPRASALAASHKLDELHPIYLSSIRYTTYINLAALGMITLAGDEFLRRWVGEEFLAQGYPVLVLITLAYLVDSLTNIPSLVNDALGHPKVTGHFALARGLIGISLVYIGTLQAGIVGAAVAHLAASILLGAAFLWFVHGRTVPYKLTETLSTGYGRSLLVGVAIFAVLLPMKWLFPAGVVSTIAIAGMALLFLLLAGFAFVVSVDERAALLAVARRLRS
jgi:O-antigen/teichoic acid export membrane protein